MEKYSFLKSKNEVICWKLSKDIQYICLELNGIENVMSGGNIQTVQTWFSDKGQEGTACRRGQVDD